MQLDLLAELTARITAGKGVPRIGARALRAFFDATRVDGLQLRTESDATVATAWVRQTATGRAAAARLAELTGPLGAPPVDPAAPGFTTQFQAAVQRLGRAVVWESDTRGPLVDRIRAVLPDLPARPDSARLAEVAAALSAAVNRETELTVTKRLAQLRSALETGQATEAASPLWGVLRDALDRRDFTAWSSVLEESARLAGLRPRLHRRDELVDRLASVAPKWAELIVSAGGVAEQCGDPADLGDLWRWRQAETWLAGILRHGDAEELRQQMARGTEQVQRLALELAARSARLGVKRNLRDHQRRALLSWSQALARIGKRQGKYVAKWEAEARAHLPTAIGAIPVWIMPIHQVFRSFDPRVTDLFDVVIVDESSQCDVLSLGVLALGRKVVVVGDDKQISPSAVGVDRSAVSRLIDAHLPDLPDRGLLDAESSMYDTAARAFGSVVLLCEHFRCVPDIIGFSNRFYDNKILPLREASELDIGPAVRPVRVADGVRGPTQYGDANEAEARALVDQLLTCCTDPAYQDMTFGVVTLLGTGQGRLIEQLLLHKLGVDEYERRRIRVGDPYHFQGDERDVIFLSLVADNLGRYTANRRSEQQRINVAASRARDQLWIFHSMDPGRLRPDDVRGQLLDYAYGVSTGTSRLVDLEQRCESDFERAVLREVLARGFDVRVQHAVGNFRIDLVVNGTRDRLAVECDGDRFHGPEQWEADIRRQRVLERLGWTFFRIRGSAFYRNPNAALAPLWERLDGLGIGPTHPSRPPARPPAPAEPAPSLVSADDDGPAEVVELVEPIEPLELVNLAVVAEPESPKPAEHDEHDDAGEDEPAEDGDEEYDEDERAEADESPALSNVPAPRATRAPTKVGKGSFVPVPEGYRSVAWIRPAEAAAVLRALRTRTDQTVRATEENIGSVVRYVPPEDPDARKFRANALVIRMRSTGPKFVAWIRRYEAEACVRAAETGQDVRFDDETGKHRGLVAYYPPDSEIAQTYRSVVRLLRARPAGRA